MNTRAKRKTRLSRAKWLETAMAVLVKDGVGSVTIERLARLLGVTRGSFYHHFDNRRDLQLALLDFWREQATLRIRDEVRALGLDPVTTLLALSRTIRHRGAAADDVAFRNWAMHDADARQCVQETDEIRLGFIRELFAEAGFSGDDLENRARLFYYYEMADPMVFAEQPKELEDALIALRHRLLTGTSAES